MAHGARLASTVRIEEPRLSVKSTISFVRAVVRGFNEHDVMSLAAAVAFYTVLSFAPLILLLVTIGSLLGEKAQLDMLDSFYDQLGPDARVVGAEVERHARAAGSPWESWRWIVSLSILLFSASLVFAQLQKSLNRIWGAHAGGKQGFFGWLWKRMISMGMVFAIMFILLVAMVVTTVIEMIIPTSNEYVGRAAVLFVSLLVTTLLFAAIFKVLPDVRISWKEVWIGAMTTSILFTLGKALVSFYLEHGGVARSYGNAVAGLITMLLWVYYSCIILFIGAEMTAQYDQARAARRRAREAAAMAAHAKVMESGAANAAAAITEKHGTGAATIAASEAIAHSHSKPGA